MLEVKLALNGPSASISQSCVPLYLHPIGIYYPDDSAPNQNGDVSKIYHISNLEVVHILPLQPLHG